MTKPKKEFRQTFFTVRGATRFPIDQLRYDRACPLTEADSHKIEACEPGMPDPIEIRLTRFTGDALLPTNARWQSFGWQVIKTGEDF